jgi:dihydroorotase
MKTEIVNGTVIDPAAGTALAGGVYISDGVIAAVGAAPARWRTDQRIDASGLMVAPGFIDLAARLREPGFEYKATLESEIEAACAGGVTRLACPPDTDPPLDEPGLIEMLRQRARTQQRVHVHPVGALTRGLAGEELTEMNELSEAGCVAFSQANHPLVDTQVLLRALQYAATFGFPVWLRPQDAWLGKGGVAHDGEVATRLGLAAIPTIAETVAVTTLVTLMRATGARVHLCRLSSAEAVAMVRAAKAEGLPLTADVSIHHLHLCDMDIGWFNSEMHLSPPLRGTRDREALRRAVVDGTIDAICSDHTPVDEDAKQLPFAEAAPGATGLELLLPLTLKWASEEKLPLPQALARITTLPARVLGMPGVGGIAAGAPADLCVFDAGAWWRVEPGALRSQGKNSPFTGLEVPGKVRWTFLGGEAVYRSVNES